MLIKLKLRYSFVAFLSLLTVLTIEAPILASYAEENKSFLQDDLNYLWKEDKAGFKTFLQRATTRLPKYESYFQDAAKNIDVHWTLIAAISYQESHWNPKAISNTGVRGMMMLTQKTAKEMGIKKRTHPEDSISGGAKYFQKIMDKFPSEISKLDTIWMSLAAYNLGYKNIELARDLSKSRGLNPNLWSEVSEVLEVILVDRYGKESNEFVKYDHVMQYVKRIDLYYKTLSMLYKDKELLLLAQK